MIRSKKFPFIHRIYFLNLFGFLIIILVLCTNDITAPINPKGKLCSTFHLTDVNVPLNDPEEPWANAEPEFIDSFSLSLLTDQDLLDRLREDFDIIQADIGEKYMDLLRVYHELLQIPIRIALTETERSQDIKSIMEILEQHKATTKSFIKYWKRKKALALHPIASKMVIFNIDQLGEYKYLIKLIDSSLNSYDEFADKVTEMYEFRIQEIRSGINVKFDFSQLTDAELERAVKIMEDSIAHIMDLMKGKLVQKRIFL